MFIIKVNLKQNQLLLFVNIELFVIIIIMNIKPVKLVRVNKFLHIWNNNIQLVFNETIHVDDDGREWLWLMVFMVLYDAYLQHRAFLIQFHLSFCSLNITTILSLSGHILSTYSQLFYQHWETKTKTIINEYFLVDFSRCPFQTKLPLNFS